MNTCIYIAPVNQKSSEAQRQTDVQTANDGAIITLEEPRSVWCWLVKLLHVKSTLRSVDSQLLQLGDQIRDRDTD